MATATSRPEDIYLWRIQVWKEVADASRGLPIPPTEKITRTNQPLVRQQRYAPAETHISVVDADCIEVAQQLMMTHPGTRPVVLNLSDDAAAGGCVFTGSGAQEECLWRRTGLCHTQTQKFYPLCTPSPSLSLLYSPQVPVLRESEANQYAWIQKPFPLDFIACPALKYPKVTPTQDLSDKDKQILEDRLRFILDVAIMKNNDSIVLGAMGCGAWKNPPKAVAKIFAKVLPEYRGYFRNIVVAILTTSNTRGPTLASIFQEAMTEEG